MHISFPSFPINSSLKGKTPSLFPEQFKNISKRAREILINRSEKEIKFAVLTINDLRFDKSMQDFLSSEKNRKKMFVISKADYEIYEKIKPSALSPSKMLIEEFKKYDFSKQIEFPNATLSEYLAVLALALIGTVIEKIRVLKKNSEMNLLDEDDYYLKSSGVIETNAMEAICLANQLYEIEKIEKDFNVSVDQRVNEKRKINIEEIRKKRHGKTLNLEWEFIQYYLEGIFPSRREAARRFYDTLPENKKKILVPENAVRTLTDALRKFEKGEFNYSQ